MAVKLTTVTKENLSAFVAQVMAGAALVISDPTPSGYTRQFQHTDWIDFVDPVQAGGGNGFNERFHALESEFDLISGAITSVDNALTTVEANPPAIGITIATSISNGATIPIPAGYLLSETMFFAFPKFFEVNLAQAAGAQIGFSVYANNAGVVNAGTFNSGLGQSLLATGIAISKKGGW